MEASLDLGGRQDAGSEKASCGQPCFFLTGDAMQGWPCQLAPVEGSIANMRNLMAAYCYRHMVLEFEQSEHGLDYVVLYSLLHL